MNSHPLSLTHPYVALTLTTAALQVVGTRELSTRGESKQVWESYRRRLVVGKGKWESVAWAWRIPSSTSPGSHERGWVGLEYNVQYAVVRDTTPTTNDGFPVSFLFQWRALHAAEQTSWWCFLFGLTLPYHTKPHWVFFPRTIEGGCNMGASPRAFSLDRIRKWLKVMEDSKASRRAEHRISIVQTRSFCKRPWAPPANVVDSGNKATIKANTYSGAVAAIQYPLLSIGAEKRTLTSRSLHQPLKDPQPHWQITRKAWEIWCSTRYARA